MRITNLHFFLNTYLQTIIKFYLQLCADILLTFKTVLFLFHRAGGSIYKALLFYDFFLLGSKFIQCFI